MPDVVGLPPGRVARILDRFERLVARSLRAVTRRMAAEVRTSPTPADVTVPDVAAVPSMWVGQVDGRLMPYLTRVWEQSAVEVARRVLGEQPPLAATVADYMAAARPRMVRVGDLVWNQVAVSLADGIAAGEDVRQLAARVADAAGVAQPRALVVARTEVHAAVQAGAFAQVQMLGDPSITKRWRTEHDHRVRDTHRVADGQTVGLNDMFEVGGAGLLYPGYPLGPPEEIIQCRCEVIYEVPAPLVAAVITKDASGRCHGLRGRFVRCGDAEQAAAAAADIAVDVTRRTERTSRRVTGTRERLATRPTRKRKLASTDVKADLETARGISPEATKARTRIKRTVRSVYSYTDKETGYKVNIDKVESVPGTSNVSVDFTIHDEDGIRVGQGKRFWAIHFQTGQLVVTHSLLDLVPQARGGGFAARFNAQAEEAYRQAGVSEIYLHANLDVGGYAWAVQGYDFRDEEGFNDVVGRARKLRRGASAADVAGLLARAAEGFDSPNRPTPYEFAMIGRDRAVPRELPSGRTILVWAGKTMMAPARWHGRRAVSPPVVTAAAGGASLLEDVALDALAYAMVVADEVPADITDVGGNPESTDPSEYPANHHLFSAPPDVGQVWLDMADATLDAHGLGDTPPPPGRPAAVEVPDGTVTAAADRDYIRDDRGRFAKHASDIVKILTDTMLGGDMSLGLRRDGGVTLQLDPETGEGSVLHIRPDEIEAVDDAMFAMWRKRGDDPIEGEDELVAEQLVPLTGGDLMVSMSNRTVEETNDQTGETEYFYEPVLTLTWGDDDQTLELDEQDFDQVIATLDQYKEEGAKPAETVEAAGYGLNLMFDGSLTFDPGDGESLTIPADKIDGLIEALEYLDAVPAEQIEAVDGDDPVDGAGPEEISADLFGDGTVSITNSDTGEDASIDITEVREVIDALNGLAETRQRVAAEALAEAQDQEPTTAAASPEGDTVPWHIEANSDQCPAGEPWAVVKDADDTVEGCHPTRAAAVAQLRALYASEGESGHTGAMIALVPAAEHADRLAVDEGEPAGQLHLTLAYLGDAGTITPVDRARLVAALAGAPWPGTVHADGFAVSLYNHQNPDRDTCAVLGCSGADLDTYRDQAVAVAAGVLGDRLPEQHTPYVPHVTLRYADDPAMVEAYADRAGPVTFDRLRVAFAGENVDLPLQPPPAPAPEPSTVDIHDEGATPVDEARAELGMAAGPVEHLHTVVRENVSTGWRTFLPGSLEWRDPPFAYHWQLASSAHGGDPVVVQVGNVVRVERHGEEAHMWAVLDLADPTAVEYGRKVADGFAIWSSVGADESVQDKDIEYVYPEGTPEDEQAFTMPEELRFRRFRIAETTGVSVPAQADADVEALPALRSALADMGVLVAATATSAISVVEPPPAWWFDEPVDVEMRGALTVTDQGRIYGYVAPAGLRHRDRGVTVPVGRVDYDGWAGGEVITASGRLAGVGPVTMDCGHAATELRPYAARRQHYDNTCSVVARARVGETADRSVWFAGALMPGLDPNTVARIMACRLSGDWQPHPQRRGWQEFIAALLVPVPAFAMRRTGPSASYDDTGLLVASAVPVQYQPTGILAGDPDGALAPVLDRILAPYGMDRAARLAAALARHPVP